MEYEQRLFSQVVDNTSQLKKLIALLKPDDSNNIDTDSIESVTIGIQQLVDDNTAMIEEIVEYNDSIDFDIVQWQSE